MNCSAFEPQIEKICRKNDECRRKLQQTCQASADPVMWQQQVQCWAKTCPSHTSECPVKYLETCTVSLLNRKQ